MTLRALSTDKALFLSRFSLTLIEIPANLKMVFEEQENLRCLRSLFIIVIFAAVMAAAS